MNTTEGHARVDTRLHRAVVMEPVSDRERQTLSRIDACDGACRQGRDCRCAPEEMTALATLRAAEAVGVAALVFVALMSVGAAAMMVLAW